jgi:hypothetical protein
MVDTLGEVVDLEVDEEVVNMEATVAVMEVCVVVIEEVVDLEVNEEVVNMEAMVAVMEVCVVVIEEVEVRVGVGWMVDTTVEDMKEETVDWMVE